MIKTHTIGFFFLFLSTFSIAQTIDYSLSGKSLQYLKDADVENPLVPYYYYQLTFLKKVLIQQGIPNCFNPKKYQGKAHSAFFCKLEDRLEKKTKTAFRFRLGSLEYVDKLEGKR